MKNFILIVALAATFISTSWAVRYYCELVAMREASEILASIGEGAQIFHIAADEIFAVKKAD